MKPFFLNSIIMLVVVLFVLPIHPRASAAGKLAIVRELVEAIHRKLAKPLSREASEALPHRVNDAITKHGDDAALAIRRTGPQALEVIEQAGPHAPDAVRLMIRRGDEALWVVSEPKRLAIFVKHGDDAAEAMIRHREVIEPLLEAFGTPAARALARVNSQNARRIVMMTKDGELARMGRTDELLAVVQRWGDRAMDFIWRHKVTLAGSAALAAFLADPEPFLDGARQLGSATGEAVAGPLVQRAAKQAGGRALWVAAGGLALMLVWRLALRQLLFGGLLWRSLRRLFRRPAVASPFRIR